APTMISTGPPALRITLTSFFLPCLKVGINKVITASFRRVRTRGTPFSFQGLMVEPVDWQWVRTPTRLALVGSHLRGDRFLRLGPKFKATSADGPLGDRTLVPPDLSLVNTVLPSRRFFRLHRASCIHAEAFSAERARSDR